MTTKGCGRRDRGGNAVVRPRGADAAPGSRRRKFVRLILVRAAGLVLCIGACSCDGDRGRPATTQPADDSSSESNGTLAKGEPISKPVELFDENDDWPRADALLKLDDETDGVSAAVRLARLADVSPLILPRPLPAAYAARLKVVRLSEFGVWVLGWQDTTIEGALRGPIFFDAKESVTLAAEGLEEELLLMLLSDDGEVFPHLLLLPREVRFLTGSADTADLTNALVLTSPESVRFALGERDGYRYIKLVLMHEGECKEVAEYRWDPYDLSFKGPAIDKLPFPPGGKFELDLELSTGLIPEGGEIPEADPAEQPLPERPKKILRDWTLGPASWKRPVRV